MIRTLALATVWTLKNRVLHQLKRLRQPRYLVSALAGFAYFFFLFSRQGRARSAMHDVPLDVPSFLLLQLLLAAWIIPAMSSLEFTEAEMHFLFTAPVTRARVLLYKLIRSQPGIVIGIVVALLFRLPKAGFIGLWVVYTTVMIYMMFVALARERLREFGVPSFVPAALALAGVIASVWLMFTRGLAAAKRGITPFTDPALQQLLAVPRFVVAPVLKPTLSSLLTHLPVIAVAAVVIFFLASRFKVNFNELVITASQRAARWKGAGGARDAFPIRRVPPLFRLRDGFPPEVAIAWKNLTAVARIAGAGILFSIAGYTFLVYMGATREIWMAAAMPICLFMSAAFPMAGAWMIRQDFRMDVMRLDVLKTFPVEGTRVVAAEIAAPIAAASLVELWFLGGLVVLLSRGGGHGFEYWPQALVIAFLFTIPVCAIQFVLQNAIPLFYPGWTARTKEDQRGIAVMGQRILGFLLNIVVLGVAVAPSAVVAGMAFFLAQRFARDSQLVLAASTLPAIAILVAEAWFAVRLLGAQYDRMDLARDLEPGMM